MVDPSKISLLCFFASYGIALGFDVARGVGKLPLRPWWGLLWTAAGLVAHSSFLWLRAQDAIAARGMPLSNWHDWCVLLAWCLMVPYVLLRWNRIESDLGIFFLPPVLTMLAWAHRFGQSSVFSTVEAARGWRFLHGFGLIGGTGLATVGLACGVMYLVQSHRLKRKRPSVGQPKLPSLEWLGGANRMVLTWSPWLLTCSILAGFVLRGFPETGAWWQDRTIPASMFLVAWLVVVTCFTKIYRPARAGQKVAYLTLSNFLVLLLTLGVVLGGGHATQGALPTEDSAETLHAVPSPEDAQGEGP